MTRTATPSSSRGTWADPRVERPGEDAMRTTRRHVAMLVGLGICRAPCARAVEQTIVGRAFVVKDPAPGVDPTRRSVLVVGKEAFSANTIVGDPVSNGAEVTIIANGSNSTSQ